MVAAALLAMGTPKVARAANLTWTQDGFDSGLAWTKTTNWGVNALFPDAEGDTANLNINLQGDQTISLGKSIRLGTLNIGDTVASYNAFTLAGGLVGGVTGTNGYIVMDALGGASAAINKFGLGQSDEITAGIYFNNDLVVTANTAGGILKFTGGIRSSFNNITFDGAGQVTINSQILSGGGITKNGAGTLMLGTSLSNVMIYTGSTAINAGKVQTGLASVIPPRSAVVIASGATLDINNVAQTVGSIAGAGTVMNSGGTATSLTFGRDDTTTSFSGNFVATTIGNLTLTKLGVGTFTLNSANDSLFTGALTISGGTFAVDFANVAGPASLTTALTRPLRRTSPSPVPQVWRSVASSRARVSPRTLTSPQSAGTSSR